MEWLREIFFEYLVRRKWGRVQNLPLPRRDDRTGEVLFGVINLVVFVSALVLLPFLLGVTASLFLKGDAKNLLWQIIIYLALGVWVTCAVVAYPAAIVYHARYGLWRRVWFLAIAILGIVLVAYVLIKHL